MTQKKPNGPCPFGAYRQHEWMIRADNDVVECNLCQAAANIGLFAAAPDLLAALEVGERFMAAWLADHSMDEWPLGKYEAIEMTHAAIVKAKGGSATT